MRDGKGAIVKRNDLIMIFIGGESRDDSMKAIRLMAHSNVILKPASSSVPLYFPPENENTKHSFLDSRGVSQN